MARNQSSRLRTKPRKRTKAVAKKNRENGSKGGLARAKSRSPEDRKKDSSKGGVACLLAYGHEHYSKLQKNWWGSLSLEQQEARREHMRKLNRKRWSKKHGKILRD